MPYTASQLTTFYSNANLGIQPTAAESLLLAAYAQQDQSGSLTDAQTLANVLQFSQDKTDVALGTYQFFTGATPSLAGLAFLVHGGSNPTDLSSSYYAQFNKENRYYNFAVNLATGSSGAANFAASYGAVTFAQAVQAAYETIVGTSNVGATQAAAVLLRLGRRIARAERQPGHRHQGDRHWLHPGRSPEGRRRRLRQGHRSIRDLAGHHGHRQHRQSAGQLSRG
jgi:hypothetical protein